MSILCYSVNEEEYDEGDAQIVVDHCEENLSAGDKFTYWVGDKVAYSHSDFIKEWDLVTLIESMRGRAHEGAGEFADNYLNGEISPEKYEEFKDIITRFMNAICTTPTFFTVVNVKAVQAIWDGSEFKNIESDVIDNISKVAV